MVYFNPSFRRFKCLNNTRITLHDGQVVDPETHIITMEALPGSYNNHVVREALEIIKQNIISAEKVVLKIKGCQVEITYKSTLNQVLDEIRELTRKSNSQSEDENLYQPQ